MTSTAVVLFTRDLRVRDNPTLWQAVHDHDRVVPLFVLDDGILGGDFNRPNRATFLAESLADLDASLRDRGAGLVIRRGRLEREVREVVQAVGAEAVHVSFDASGFSSTRVRRLREALDVEVVGHDDTLFVVPPGRVTPSGGGDHMSVFSAYYRRWSDQHRRPVHGAPRAIEMPRIARGKLPKPDGICRGDRSPDLAAGGETAARSRLAAWLRADAADYAEKHDDLAADATSRLSPYLHFGCLSPLELVSRQGVVGDFVRQVAWRDFHAQVLAARPGSTQRDYRSRGDRWRRSDRDLQAWKDGRTGLPVVDAGMRQLAREGWMHNRARLIVGHLLVKTLYLDWRLGAQHFVDLLLDADTGNNTMNWQWVAGTGTDSRFNRTYNVDSQAKRYDPSGDYVRRYVPELRDVEGPAVHRPWTLPDDVRRTLDYPDPIVDVAEGNRRFLHARGAD
ncbi:deoxyribodipyrimidine photo-lyase [Jatrophihabitans endophyticus]|uniref:cryptochrome/photolyase family protein n=1 Tax=Jatrophihabitans endophyticus TaxID=1206085 RepID=UPI0019EFBBBB|nr:deoxyribodipyrimidine photo-lyase [Jatrophihabitans endophyticus]MBE7187708.1 deoxyribodipyrimidine photo-lyase [Jatrophihabitans endophyticus]